MWYIVVIENLTARSKTLNTFIFSLIIETKHKSINPNTDKNKRTKPVMEEKQPYDCHI